MKDEELQEGISRLRKTSHDISNKLQTLIYIATARGIKVDQPQSEVSELSISKEGISLKSVTMNTLLTLACLGAAAFAAYGVHEHRTESKEAAGAFVKALSDQTGAIKEQTAAQREQTCIMKFDQAQRQANADFCKQVSGSR